MSSEFKPGQRLPSEAQLADGFKVSRATVREALRSLATDGLISKQQGASGGSFVEAVDHESLASELSTSMDTILKLGRITHDEVERVRVILEVPGAELAARNRTRADLADLERMLQAGAVSEGVGVGDFDAEFHRRIVAASGNRVLLALFTALVRVLRGSGALEYTGDAEQAVAAFHDQHRVLLDAIAAGDPDAAGKAMAEHIVYFEQSVRAGGRD